MITQLTCLHSKEGMREADMGFTFWKVNRRLPWMMSSLQNMSMGPGGSSWHSVCQAHIGPWVWFPTWGEKGICPCSNAKSVNGLYLEKKSLCRCNCIKELKMQFSLLSYYYYCGVFLLSWNTPNTKHRMCGVFLYTKQIFNVWDSNWISYNLIPFWY